MSFFYTILNQGIIAAFPFFMLPLLLERIGLEAYGNYVHAMIVANIIFAIFSNSFNGFYSRIYSESYKNDNNRDAFSTIAVLQIFFCIIGLAIYTCILIAFNLESIYTIGYFLIIACAFNFEWYFYFENKVKHVFFRMILSRVLILTSTLFFVKNKDDVELYFLIYSLFSFFYFVMGFFYIFKKEEIVFQAVNFKKIFETRFFFFSGVIGALQSQGDQLVIGFIFSKDSLAYLSIIRQIISACCSFTGAVCRVLLPISLSIYQEALTMHARFFKKSILLFLFIILIFSIGFFIFGNYVVGFLSKELLFLSDGEIFLCIYSVAITSLAMLLDTFLSITKKKEWITLISNIFVGPLFVGMTIIIASGEYIFLGLKNYSMPILILALAETVGVIIVVILHLFKARK